MKNKIILFLVQTIKLLLINFLLFLATIILSVLTDYVYICIDNMDRYGKSAAMYLGIIGVFICFPVSFLISLFLNFIWNDKLSYIFLLIFWLIFSILYIECTQHEITTLTKSLNILISILYFALIHIFTNKILFFNKKNNVM